MVNAVSQRLVACTIWCPVKMVTIISDVDVSDVEGAATFSFVTCTLSLILIQDLEFHGYAKISDLLVFDG